MTDYQKTILDYAVRETAAEADMVMPERLHRCLARSGYIPVLHVSDETKPSCPQGFFMMEFRRLDDPRFRAVTSLRTSAPPEDALQVTFDTTPLPRERSWRGLVEAFRYRATQVAPITMSASHAVPSYIKGDHLPNGGAQASRYADLAYTLQHRTGHTFFIDPHRISADFVIVQTTVDPGVYKRPGEANPGSLDRLLNKRRVLIAVPTQLKEENRGIYIRAEYALSIHDPAATPAQYMSMRQFSHAFPEVIGAHVRGKPPVFPSFGNKRTPKNF
ncbi:MAG: hypothetical protein HYS17_00205 [Micavibrio aeruginosavorus]|uniref:Uncharacterized protein n=1 Tax=Micavibrio aeruginosavorus TaxID=349221 RepID=A0A7T5R2I2_9BACT|nr:MAG: hypothetical protein HYS17_00205 [Micavibrio aeruginosavorus]